MQCASAARDELRFAHVCVLAKPMGRSRGMGGVFASRTTAEAELIWWRAEACRGVEVSRSAKVDGVSIVQKTMTFLLFAIEQTATRYFAMIC